MADKVLDFYNDLTDDYHLILDNWDNTIRDQGRSLKEFLQKYFSKSDNLSILDCSCGIGTQAIGLALQGYKVTGTDISKKEIDRAEREGIRLGASLSLRVADFQRLEDVITEQFDVVISFDNAVAHLKDVNELQLALSSMRRRLKPKGILLVSTRNNDNLRAQKPCGTLPRTVEDQFGKRIITQSWEWNQSGDGYLLTMFIIQKRKNEWVSKSYSPVPMRAFNREEISQSLKSAGAINIDWNLTKEIGYYQPVVLANFS